MIATIERMDIIGVVRILRSNPLTRHLSRTALSRLTGVSQSTTSGWESGNRVPDPRRAIEVLEGLGVPGAPWGRRWLLPEDFTTATASDPADVGAALAPCVVITVPEPIDVQVMQSNEDGDTPTAAVAFVADRRGPRLVVSPGSIWGVTSSPTGATAWFALKSNERSSLIAHETTRPS